MSSSIFNFSHFRAYCSLPRRTRAWHLILCAGCAAILVAGTQTLRSLGNEDPPPEIPYTSLINDELEVMFVGSSHVGYGIDPRQYSMRGLNVTAGAMNYQCAEIYLRKHLDQAPNLKVLVIEAGIIPLRVNTMLRMDGDYRTLYRIGLDTFDLPLSPYRKVMQWVRESWLFYPVYFLERMSPSLLIWGSRPLGGEGEGRIDTLGHSTLDLVISEKTDGRAVVERHMQDHLRVDHSGANLPALLRVLKMAENRNLPVVFIRMPHHRTYIEHRPEAWEEQYQAMVEKVRQVMRPDLLRYLDWEQLPELKDEHFGDGDHLNRAGVQVLRDKLDPVLLEYR